ncbi:hypothetical protein RFI_05983 [Reticulomyxa filosa]|uniref:Solute carrier family 25 member 40 n=1 Tax=Reticulomyxa filosa TaxID=46433 RepID=X6P0S9_RETFI|nr:hypothetical protein RFI_05983 [Reticulomyxa filosa]|eukprot:ETO31142.1 hypothetical protein RFI_05983 [Reticulomyxa filosa]
MNPTDVLKTQMQASQTLHRLRMSVVISNIYKKEGIVGFWAGVRPNVARAFLINAAEIGTYDHIKKELLHTYKVVNQDGLLLTVYSSFGAAIISACVSTPVDVVKTRLMNQSGRVHEYRGMFHGLVSIPRKEGVMALYKGFIPIIVRKVAWCTLYFVTYERKGEKKYCETCLWVEAFLFPPFWPLFLFLSFERKMRNKLFNLSYLPKHGFVTIILFPFTFNLDFLQFFFGKAVFGSLLSVTTAVLGIDVAGDVSDWSCLAENIEFMITRAWHSYGAFDDTSIHNLDDAQAAGVKYTDVYLFPCASESPVEQVNWMMGNLSESLSKWKKVPQNLNSTVEYGMVWLDIEYNPSTGCSWADYSSSSNCDYVQKVQSFFFYVFSDSYTLPLTKQTNKQKMAEQVVKNGKSVGIYSSQYEWQTVMGQVHACTALSSYQLWYAHYDVKSKQPMCTQKKKK